MIAELDLAASGLDVRGACAGDARAWARRGGAWLELSRSAARKPLVGSGASPTAFELRGVSAILCASDGLASWGGPDDARYAIDFDDDALTTTLADLVRLPTGRLADDLCVVWVRLV